MNTAWYLKGLVAIFLGLTLSFLEELLLGRTFVVLKPSNLLVAFLLTNGLFVSFKMIEFVERFFRQRKNGGDNA